jgi:hypothetical protein
MRHAVDELKGLVQERYPQATFHVTRSPEDRSVIHLVTTVDVPDTTEVVDAVLDRVLQLQIDENLPVHVIPVRPRDRVLAMAREQHAERKPRRSPTPLNP